MRQALSTGSPVANHDRSNVLITMIDLMRQALPTGSPVVFHVLLVFELVFVSFDALENVRR